MIKRKRNNLFESRLMKSIRKRAMMLEADDMDRLADDLTTTLEAKNDPDVDSDLENGLSEDHNALAEEQYQTIEEIKKEDEVLKSKITKRIEHANDQIIEYAEKVEDFINFLNNPDDPLSIKYAMDNSTENSPLGKAKTTCNKRLGRIAADLAGLSQQLRSVVGSTTVDDMLM